MKGKGWRHVKDVQTVGVTWWKWKKLGPLTASERLVRAVYGNAWLRMQSDQNGTRFPQEFRLRSGQNGQPILYVCHVIPLVCTLAY
jgi:hypothetical protein